MGWINSVGVFQEYYQTDLLRRYSSSTIAWIPSLEIFFILGMGPIVGRLYDKFGPRWLILGGSLMHVFGVMMASISTEYYQILLAQGICSGIGVSAYFSHLTHTALGAAVGWFDQKRGAAFGLIFTGSSVGGVVFPIMVTHLIKELGYGWAMRICGFLLLALLLITCLTVKSRVPPRPHNITGAQLLQPFREPAFVGCVLGFFFLTFGSFVPMNYLPVQALQAGVNPNLVQYLIPILNAGSLFGRLSAGIIGDRLGMYNVYSLVGTVSGIWVLALWIPCNTQNGLIAFAALFGFSSGAYISLVTPAIAKVSPLPEIGFRNGLVFAVASLAGLTTNPINGAILELSTGWLGPKIFAGTLLIVGSMFILSVRIYRVGWKLNAKF
ncbi:Riboflavin transporter MCH5 [Cyphellophora attinorum]|uniref:Riboflavin transporter MCH5 n=1 Tax=Cyphellophora attinorum TaxID=1664694 RepID=A0A0N1P037_9EURO|nr:Riboflavin transporter MCH5 [Phialophora attinorum]KPI42952.1 Riboflavin transporter MCH5 [Phialophora attinorum]